MQGLRRHVGGAILGERGKVISKGMDFPRVDVSRGGKGGRMLPVGNSGPGEGADGGETRAKEGNEEMM